MTAQAPWSVPTVDIASYTGLASPAGRAQTAREMDGACRRVGFVQVIGHGVPDAAITGLTRAIDSFFALDAHDKLRFRSAGTNRGYTPPKSEALSLSAGIAPSTRMKDFFEAFNVGVPASAYPDLGLSSDHYAENTWPDHAGSFRTDVQTYLDEARRVARTLTDVFADALGLPQGFFAPYTDHSIEVLRMNNYALPDGVKAEGDLTGMGEHTDFGIVTVLWADQIPGLQVLGNDSAWHDVSPAPGALLVNLGDLMARWTNDHWMSTLHRVKPPIVDGQVRRRRSAALFHDGNADAVISTLPTLATGTGPGYPPITVADHIDLKLGGSRGGVLNSSALREAARIKAAVQ